MLKRAAYICMALSVLVPLVLLNQKAVAAVDSCGAQVVQHSVGQGSNTDFRFSIDNTSSSPINWIKITRPSANFTDINGNLPYAPWVGSNDTDSATFTGGTINPGDTLDPVFINANAAAAAPSANWTVEVSEASDGTGAISCTGSLGTSITSPPPAISNIAISNISSSGVTISWDTDSASTSKVDYGLDTGYGQSSPTDSNLVTSHSVTLSGLSANTTYHFQVTSANSDGTATTSGDSTFLTAVAGTTQVHTVTVPINVAVTNPGDKVPPTISLSTKFAQSQIFKTPPTFKGQAKDDQAVAAVQYSTDGGKNWLPAEDTPGLGSKQVNFSFTPLNLDDGDYVVLARAVDGGGNTAQTDNQNIVIDRLPPLVGGNLISLGPQLLQPNQQGEIVAMVGVDQKMTLSAVGGATRITLQAEKQALGTSKTVGSFALTKSSDGELWSGIISFTKPGSYTLTANAIDGAGNKTSRTLNTVNVVPPATVVNKATGKALSAKVTVYYLEPESNDWVVWDGGAYSQDNPQTTDKNGQFELLLPAGKYYLKVGAGGYRTLTSSIFTTSGPTPISTTLKLKGSSWKIGPLTLGWLDLSNDKIDINAASNQVSVGQSKNNLIGQTLPNFNLIDTDGNKLNATNLFGKPTDIIITSSWAPTTAEQLSAIAKLQKNKDINIVPVALQENAGKLSAYNAISDYDITWLADPDSTLSDSFKVSGLPTHYFVGRNGQIKNIYTGVLSSGEILAAISDL